MILDSGDCSPCRWALMFDKCDTHPELCLVDLAQREQESRGKELLRLLREPVTPCAAEASTAVYLPCSPTSNGNLCVKFSSFIDSDLVPSHCQHNCKHCQSDSSHYTETHKQVTVQDNSDCAAGQSDMRPADTPQLQQVLAPQVLDLNACLRHSQCWDVAPRCMTAGADLSDASTCTPDESVEDLSLTELIDIASLGDSVIADVPDVAGAEALPTFMGLSLSVEAGGKSAEEVTTLEAQDAFLNEERAEVPRLLRTALESQTCHQDHFFCSLFPLGDYVPMQQQSAFPEVIFSQLHPVDQVCTSPHGPYTCPLLSDNPCSSLWQWNTIIMPTDCSHVKLSS